MIKIKLTDNVFFYGEGIAGMDSEIDNQITNLCIDYHVYATEITDFKEKNHIGNIQDCIDLIKMIYEDMPETLSLIDDAFQSGHRFVVGVHPEIPEVEENKGNIRSLRVLKYASNEEAEKDFGKHNPKVIIDNGYENISDIKKSIFIKGLKMLKTDRFEPTEPEVKFRLSVTRDDGVRYNGICTIDDAKRSISELYYILKEEGIVMTISNNNGDETIYVNPDKIYEMRIKEFINE